MYFSTVQVKYVFEQLCQHYKVIDGGYGILICHISYSKGSALLNILRQIKENSIKNMEGWAHLFKEIKTFFEEP